MNVILSKVEAGCGRERSGSPLPKSRGEAEGTPRRCDRIEEPALSEAEGTPTLSGYARSVR
jgi:hypothetical protein